MKILIITMIPVDKLHPRTFIFKKIIESLEKNLNVSTHWIICRSEKFITNSKPNNTVYDIHCFKDGYDILNKLKPDIILVDSHSEPIQLALTFAANYLKIPVIARPSYVVYLPTNPGKASTISQARNFFSSQTPSDDTNSKFMKRGSFFIYKILFLIRTKLKIKKNFFHVLFFTVSYLFNLFFSKKQISLNPNIDLHLLSNIEQVSNYQKFGIEKSKLVLVGNIWIDRLFSITEASKLKHEKIFEVLVITAPLYEHGFWSTNQRELFLSELFTILKNESSLSLSVKIHPTSESYDYYKNLLKSLNLNIPIFQSEDLLDLIPKYNLFITYGASNVLSDLAFLQKRVICLPLGHSIGIRPLVSESISSGFIKICSDLANLSADLNELIVSIPKPNEDYIQKRNKLFFNLDGKSADRSASAIIAFLKNDFSKSEKFI